MIMSYANRWIVLKIMIKGCLCSGGEGVFMNNVRTIKEKIMKSMKYDIFKRFNFQLDTSVLFVPDKVKSGFDRHMF